MNKKHFLRLVSIFLCLVIATGSVFVYKNDILADGESTASSEETITYASVPPYYMEAQVKQRMDDLLNCLSGKYFTVNGTYCNRTFVYGHGCNNCKM